MRPWIVVCCVSSATVSTSSATSSLRCPRTGTSKLPDPSPPCAAFRHPPGFSPDGEGSGLFFKETLMGWTFVRQTRDQLIRELLAPQASERACCEVIDHTLAGDVLWTVVRVTARQAGVMGLAAGESVCYIGYHMLESSGGDWGYKSLDESVHPYYYSCPLRYLDMAPVQRDRKSTRLNSSHHSISYAV